MLEPLVKLLDLVLLVGVVEVEVVDKSNCPEEANDERSAASRSEGRRGLRDIHLSGIRKCMRARSSVVMTREKGSERGGWALRKRERDEPLTLF